jgi:uncharacterized protein (TIGR02996 family)
MTQDEAFLQAIIEAPDDDAPRLVYADWLDDSGDPERAEFIRAQCELARPGPTGARRRELQQRQRTLLSQNARRWGAAALRRTRARNYRRGFVEVLQTSPLWLMRFGEQVFQRFPIREVRLHALDDQWDGSRRSIRNFVSWLAKWPPLGRFEALALWGHSAGGAVTIDPRSLPVLLASPHLRRLRALDISDNVDMNGAAEALAQSPVLGQLTALVLCLFDPGVVNSLVQAPFIPRLERLHLPCNQVGPHAAERLADWPALATVTDLDLSDNALGPGGAQALAASPHLCGLRQLRLARAAIGDRGLIALVESGKLDAVRLLDVEGNFGGAGTYIGSTGAQALARLLSLRRLNLRDNLLGDAGVRALAESAALASLRRLNVGLNGSSDEGARALARSRHLRLTELTAYANAFTDDGVAALASSPVLTQVRRLRLGGNRAVGDAAALALARSPYLRRLALLDLPGTAIGPEGRRALRARFGDRVRFDAQPALEQHPGGPDIPF